ncbi:MAG: SoxR reducing system RseC family protein [Desulfobacterales bacterium]
MAERIGIVLHTLDNGMAEVVTDRRNACGGCEKSHGCRTCLASSKMVSTVQNPAGAGQGDVVSIYLKESALWTGAVFLYIVPILWLMAGAFVGSSLGRNWSMGETGAAILLGLLGLALGFLMARVISKSSSFGPKIVPRIVRVVEHAKTKEEHGHHNGINTTPTAACCG